MRVTTATTALALGAAIILPGCVSDSSMAASKKRPCHLHTQATTPTKAACLKQYRRDRMAWPREPTVAEVARRVNAIGGRGTYAKAWRIARCETGARPRWYLGPKGQVLGKYVSMMGMYHGTWRIGVRNTGGYDGSSPQEQVAVAVAAWPATRGWSGWGCSAA